MCIRDSSQSSFVTLCRILNSLWSQSLVSDSWHHYKITPIPKKDSTKLRPIALAVCIRKLVDIILNKRLTHWLESNNILPTNFFGFRPNHSTIDAISQLTMDIYESFINEQRFIATFLDIESAYPSVHWPNLSKIMAQRDLLHHFHQYINSLFINQRISITSPSAVISCNAYRGLL